MSKDIHHPKAAPTDLNPATGTSVLALSTASPRLMATIEITMPNAMLFTMETIKSGKVILASKLLK